MKTSRFFNVLFLILGAFIGVSCSSFMEGYNREPSVPVIAAQPPVEVSRESVAATEANYQLRLDSLSVVTDSVSRQALETKGQLRQARKKAAELEQQVIDRIWTNEHTTDTALILSNCDSLQDEITDVIESSHYIDSLYDRMTTDLETQVHLKESAYQLKSQDYLALKVSFSQAMDKIESQAVQSEVYRRQAKRERRKSRWLSAGMMLLSGAATYGLLHR